MPCGSASAPHEGACIFSATGEFVSNQRESIKDFVREHHVFRLRVMVAFVGVILLMIGITARYFQLQVLEHQTFTTRSEANRVKIRPIAPTRGLIFDRNGLIVAENRPAYRLEVVPERIENLDASLEKLRGLIRLTDEDIAAFHRLLRLKRDFHSVPLRLNLSDTEVARFAVNRHRFPGIEITPHLTRHYPLGKHLAHVVGYVGRIDVDDLRSADAGQYTASSHIGKSGIERTYELYLHGSPGLERVEVNAQGRVLRVLERTDPVPGSALHLNLDAGLQITAESAFEGYAGAVVAIEPNTGAVLAMVSVPSFDPNLFVSGIDSATYRELNQSPRAPLYNRALAGTYPPGSTIKPQMALAGLELGVRNLDQEVRCPGYFQLPGEERRYRDWKRRGHGQVGLARSIYESCDVYYYKLAVDLGIDRIHDYLAPFGLGEPTGIDSGPERNGLLPSREWKRQQRGLPWFPGETVITGIGQGFMLTTPVQLAVATATLATRGIRPQPQLVRAIEDPTSGMRQELESMAAGRVSVGDPRHWEEVIDAMESVVHSIRGTAHGIATDDYRIAAKTGTAQVYGMPQDQLEALDPEEVELKLRDHALFVAFAPADDPAIAVATVVEHGGSGGRVAGPVAKAVIDAYLSRKEFEFAPEAAEPVERRENDPEGARP